MGDNKMRLRDPIITNDMGKKDIEENIWTNKGEWTVEN
jgi:hypothetical protein